MIFILYKRIIKPNTDIFVSFMSSLNSKLAVYSKHNYGELRRTEKTR